MEYNIFEMVTASEDLVSEEKELITKSNPTKKYRKPVEFPYSKNCNVKMKYSTSKDKDRGYRIVVSLVSPEIEINSVVRYKDDEQILIASAETKYADYLYSRIPAGALITADDISTDRTLATLLRLRSEEMNNEVHKISADAIQIQKELCEALSHKDVSSINRDDCLMAINDCANRKAANDQDRTKMMNICTKVLKSTFDYCCSWIPCDNPMTRLTASRSLEQTITQHMKKGALTIEQDSALYQKYESDITDPVNLGIALMHLQGIDASVACGLKFGDIYHIDRLTGHMPKKPLGDLDPKENYVVFISRSYKKTIVESRSEYKITPIVNGIDSYRYIPISAACIRFIADYYWHLRSSGLDNKELLSYPIVCGKNKQGDALRKEHMKPDVLRKYVKKYLADIGVQETYYYLPPLKSSSEEKEFPIRHTKGLLRLNFQNKAKNISRFTLDELNYISGRKAKSVEARHYRDFRERYNQLDFKKKLDRWVIREKTTDRLPGVILSGELEQKVISERCVLTAAPSSNADRAHLVLHITGEPGQNIQLNCHNIYGMNGQIISKIA